MTTITAGTRPTAAATRAGQDASPAPQEHSHGSWKTGLAVAGLAGIASFQHTLMARPGKHQAIITAASLALGYGAGVGADAIAKGIERGEHPDQMASRLTIAGIGAAGVIGTTIAMRGRPNQLGLSIARTAAGVVGGGALVGAALVGEQRVAKGVGDKLGVGEAGAHVAMLGAGAAVAGTIMLGMTRPSAVSTQAEAAYKAVLETVPKAPATPPAYEPALASLVDSQRATMSTMSGKAAGSVLPVDKLDAQGLRFLRDATPREEIARVMGGSADEVTSPFRVYGGMAHATSHKELVAKVLQEAGSLRNEAGKSALDSGTVIINIPSGTGYVAPVQVQAAEYATKGDVTSIALQYWNKPSVESTGKVPKAADLVKEAMEQIVPAIRARPNGADTKIVIYSESLGSWASQDALRAGGADTVAGHGIDALVNAGTPRFSKFRTDHLGFAGHTSDASGRIIEFDNLTELPKQGTAARARLNTFLISHYDDPVTRWSPSQLVMPPAYLASVEQGTGIPRRMKWYPGVSAVQGLFDSVNGASLPRGVLGSRGHDYRGDIAPLFADIIGKPFTTEQATNVIAAANQSELAFLARTPHPTT